MDAPASAESTPSSRAAVAICALLLMVAASARIAQHLSVLPPYAGLDEVYHVARLAFVLQEGRNPTMQEPSVAPYLARSIAGDPSGLPSFGVVAERWPALVREHRVTNRRRLLSDQELRPYLYRNYEAQQPSFYYTLAAPLVRGFPRSELRELQIWRLVSAVLALITVLGAALIAWRAAGLMGLLAATLIVSVPTWLTLVARASNDALACASLAVALAISLSGSLRMGHALAEAICWGIALAAKLYTWPVALLLPFLWRAQNARRWRVSIVCLAVLFAVGMTIADLNKRTNNPLGLFAFDRPPVTDSAKPIAYGEMLRIFLATTVWTSGQHNNALTPAGMALYVLPVIGMIGIGWSRSREADRRWLLWCLLALLVFACAHAVNAAGYIRSARAEGLALPLGGKEGWYWYSLLPLLIAIPAVALRRLPLLAAALLVSWILAWDVVIHEGALYQDYAGLTTPGEGDAWFRWGPRRPVATLDLTHVAAGPGTDQAEEARLLHLITTAALLGIAARVRNRGWS